MSDAVRRLALSQSHATSRHLCPECSADRRNKHDRCLSVTVDGDSILWNCHHCQFAGAMPLLERKSLFMAQPKPVLTLTLPPPLGVEEQSLAGRPTVTTPSKAIVLQPSTESEQEMAYRWLSTRGITRATAAQAGVIGGMQFINGENQPAIGYPYRDGLDATKPYAIKWRAIGSKAFTQTGSAVSLWLADDVQQGMPITICEGEADCLALRQAGVLAVSVPNGAPGSVSEGQVAGLSANDRKYGYLWRAREKIEAAPRIVIAVDADEPGNALGEEIARRVGRARCWRALWPDGAKDANDTLLRHGPDVLKDCVDNAQPWPVKGLYDVEHFGDRVKVLYDKGFPKGESTGFRCVDELYTVAPGQLTIATGAPGSGKSAFIDNVMVSLAKAKGWRFAVCSFENPPDVHIAKLSSIAARQPFFDGPTPRMSPEKRDKVLAWVQDHFSFIHQSDGSLSSLDEILDLTRAAIMRYGVKGLVIDPYNFLDRGEANETDWVSDALTKIKVLAMAHDLHVWLCAHPTKLRRRDDGTFPVPTGYDIAGSAHFFNKADMGVTLHRPDLLENKTKFINWKTRFSFMGKVGETDLTYDIATGLYFEKVTGGDEDEL